MKELLLKLIIGILFYSCSSSKVENNKTKYFNENNIEISKSEFNESRSNRKLIEVQNDSLNIKILTNREVRGKIKNKKLFDNLLNKSVNINVDSTKPTVIIYYIGKDPYNSGGGFVDRQWMKNWKNDLEKGLNQIAEIKPIYLYKNYNGLKKHEGIIPWKKDFENQISELFFKHKYPWLSFVVISKNGDYISRFGEFTLDYVWEATQLMNK
ncbi:hypothetical protein [Pontimicrobium sp. IMCC45349]|uniref:hypothetical protein n=1 Tax=Pontimicrobium sp. IMCC45349 TaxID=3391574 RepID=UPI0039A3CD92